MAKLQDMLVASAVMKETARVKYEDVVVADFAKKVP
jgi:NitT/TauT family transport system substrate-binding protein